MESLLKMAVLCTTAYDGQKVGAHSFAVDNIGKTQLIAIAGTKNFENVMEDISVWPKKTPTGSLAHAGVMDGYKELKQAVSASIKKDKPLIFCGHSLGGGIAQIFAEVYGCPVVTFGSLKTYFRFYPAPTLEHLRVICDDDPVPLVPGVMYSHRQQPLVLNDYDHEFIDIKDHLMKNYVAQLEKMAPIVIGA